MFVVPEKRQRIHPGQRHNRLVLQGVPFYGHASKQLGVFKCDCGEVFIASVGPVFRGESKSCGCLQKEWAQGGKGGWKHGDARSRLYQTWKNMKLRCSLASHKSYGRYGGRGIRVCDEWQSYPAFQEWANSNGYDDSLTLDRIDLNQGYFPENCRWADRKQQANNRSSSVIAVAFGRSMTLAEWAGQPECVVPYYTLWSRVSRGWPIEQAITRPTNRSQRITTTIGIGGIDALAAMRKK